MEQERQHAILAASSAHRWTKCPASARLEELFMDEDTEYSKEGTVAHGFAERVLNGIFNILDTPFPNQEMESAVLEYTSYVTKLYEKMKTTCKFAFKAHEVKLDFSEVVPEGFGTADTIIISDGTMHVFDFKYGKGVPVYADENKQMMLYAYGAYMCYEMLYDIDKIQMHIVQPRIDNFSVNEITVLDLIAWAKDLKEQAELAFSGAGDTIPGEHCQFCRARALCRVRAEYLALLVDEGKNFKLMSDEELINIYPYLDTVEKLVKDIKGYMLNEALNGKKWPGLKLVEGRSVRTYADELIVLKTLKKAGFKEAELTTRKILGITDMTKLISKPKFKELLEDQGLVIKPVGKPTLASVDDKRPEYNEHENLLAQFEDLEAKEVN
jgi:hypothetical protein